MPKRQCPEAVAKQFVTNKTDPPWIEVKFIDEVKGRGVFAKSDIAHGQFISQYCGELISYVEGSRREAVGETGFRYFFSHRGSWFCLFGDDISDISLTLSSAVAEGPGDALDKRCIDGGVISKKPKESSIERESNQSVTVALFVQRLLSTGERKRKPWSAEELRVLRREFKGFQHPPGFGDIRRVQELCPALQLRTLAQIKSRAWAVLGH